MNRQRYNVLTGDSKPPSGVGAAPSGAGKNEKQLGEKQ